MPEAHDKYIEIPGTEVQTSAVGFGTSGIMGSSLTDRGRLKLLDHVLSQGICHFDTAPLYGMGEAELLLGKFTKTRRGQVTIATKYGLEPPFVPYYYRKAAPLARAIYHRSKMAKKVVDRLLSHANQPANIAVPEILPSNRISPHAPAFSRKAMEKSLNESLCKLKTEYIDIYFLHDCSATMVNAEVVETLQHFRDQGKIRSFGVATGPSACAVILSNFPALKDVVQLPSDIFNQSPIDSKLSRDSLLITYRALSQSLSHFRSLTADPQLLEKWSKVLDSDLTQPGQLLAFVMACAIKENRNGIVLFSSSKLNNIVKTTDAINNNNISYNQVDRFVLLFREYTRAHQ